MIKREINQCISNIKFNPKLALIIISTTLIIASEQFAFLNQGDFSRTIGHIANGPTGFIDVWKLNEHFQSPKFYEIYSIYLWMTGGITKLFTNSLPIFITSIFQKAILLLAIASLSKNLAKCQKNFIGIYCIAATIALLPHNSAVFKSFYPESFFIIGLTTIVSEMTANKSRRNVFLLVTGAAICGLSKVQFFYIPTLIFILYAIQNSKQRQSTQFKQIAISLFLLQTLCLAPIINNQYDQVNKYHALYLGAYMAAHEKNTSDFMIPNSELECVGVDAWGNKLSGPNGTHVTPNHKTCFGNKKITNKDIIEIYANSPTLLISVLNKALAAHITTDYFHVYPNYKYLVTLPDIGYIPRIMLSISEIRAKIPAGPLIIAIFTLPLILIFIRRFVNCFTYAYIFLILTISSQILVSLLGEGLRDLSKHLLGAQFAIDLLTLIIFLDIGRLFLNFKILNKVQNILFGPTT